MKTAIFFAIGFVILILSAFYRIKMWGWFEPLAAIAGGIIGWNGVALLQHRKNQ